MGLPAELLETCEEGMSDWTMTCDKCGYRIAWNGGISDKPPCPKCTGVDVATLTQEAQEGVELCEEILDSIGDLPERAEDFASSVSEKVESIQEWIEENDHVTEAQMDALENMKSGVERWMSS